jgi:NADH:ubiquinone oxidoreductase subunit 4 (subunit M)
LFLLTLIFCDSLLVYTFLEVLTFIVLVLMWQRAASLEGGVAGSYLLVYSLICRACYFLDLCVLGVECGNYPFLMALGLRSVMFFSKLPVYGLHYWLPKAHVEAYVVGSSLLAGLMLKLGVYVVGASAEFVLAGVILRQLAVFRSLTTPDYKVWLAFSSIMHITLVFSGLHRYFPEQLSCYLVIHTLLAAAMFYWKNRSYVSTRQRAFELYGGFAAQALIYWVWLGFPLIVMFLCELALVCLASNEGVVGGLACLILVGVFCFVASRGMHRKRGKSGVNRGVSVVALGGFVSAAYYLIPWLLIF